MVHDDLPSRRRDVSRPDWEVIGPLGRRRSRNDEQQFFRLASVHALSVPAPRHEGRFVGHNAALCGRGGNRRRLARTSERDQNGSARSTIRPEKLVLSGGGIASAVSVIRAPFSMYGLTFTPGVIANIRLVAPTDPTAVPSC